MGISGSTDKSLKLWDLETGQLLRSFDGHVLPVTSVAISPDGKTAISGSQDSTIRHWDIQTGQLIRSFEGVSDPVLSVNISQDGKIIIGGFNSNKFIFWDIQTGNLLRAIGDGRLYPNMFAFHNDRNIFLSPNGIWDLKTGKMICSLNIPGGYMKISPDWRNVITAGVGQDHALKSWDVLSDKTQVLFIDDVEIKSIELSSDGRSVVCGDIEGKVWIFEWVK